MKNISDKRDDWDSIFRSEFYSVYQASHELIKKGEIGTQEITALTNLANRFFDRFNKSPIPVRSPNLKLDYSPEIISTSVLLPYGCMMVPYFFIDVFKSDPTFSFDEEFSLEVKWSELIGLLYQKWYNQRKKLTRTIVLICKTLSRYNIEGQLYRFPISHEIIANRTRQSISIIKMTYPEMHLSSIVRDFFLINPWKVGWVLYLLSYPYKFNDDLKVHDNKTIGLEICSSKRALRIIQLPMLDDGHSLSTIQEKIRDIGGNVYEITSTDFHWELSQLMPQENKSFRKCPNFLDNAPSLSEPTVHFEFSPNGLDWLIDTPDLDEFNKKNKKNTQIITDLRKERIIAVLNYLVEYGIPMVNYVATAEKIGLPKHEFSSIIRFLIEKRIIGLAHRFKFIGAGHEYSFLIEHSSPDINRLIKQNLLQCVFSYFYESDNMLAGRLQVPDSWVAHLFEYFTRLSFRYPYLEISYGQRLIGYSFFVPNVKLPKEYILNQFGMYLAVEKIEEKNKH
jgi:hypothetical protein